jgi:hypothetical protein
MYIHSVIIIIIKILRELLCVIKVLASFNLTACNYCVHTTRSTSGRGNCFLDDNYSVLISEYRGAQTVGNCKEILYWDCADHSGPAF